MKSNMMERLNGISSYKKIKGVSIVNEKFKTKKIKITLTKVNMYSLKRVLPRSAKVSIDGNYIILPYTYFTNEDNREDFEIILKDHFVNKKSSAFTRFTLNEIKQFKFENPKLRIFKDSKTNRYYCKLGIRNYYNFLYKDSYGKIKISAYSFIQRNEYDREIKEGNFNINQIEELFDL